jgi:[ribosomal protein S5]-alanine N-acetyltransferase
MPSACPAATARLTFRCWTEDDFALATALWGDARVMKMINSQAPIDAAATRERLQRDMRNLREHLVQFWPMFLRTTGELVGACGLRPRDPQRKVLELGYALRPEFWGQGFATESARSVIEYAFGRLGASALFAGHHADNAASRRTLEKLGFRFTHEEHYAPTNSMHPCYLLERP